MNKVELLAPAGDREAFIAAIQNGADAVYIGGNSFSARAFAKNFDKEDMVWAIHYAHLRNIKVYVTVNTLYKDEEFSELIEYLDFLYQIQIDALIIQDLGLFHVVKNRYDDFEIHMSTQASVMNKYSAHYFKSAGAARVVLARENSLEEIKEIKKFTDIQLEVFVHGALCICYSGQCLMSSMIGKRSGNRGECAQPCRLEYKLKENDKVLSSDSKFLLSPKDLCTIDNIDQLIEAGVDSFKIEGRMKKPEYVAAVVKAYRKAIDDYYDCKKEDLSLEINEMKQMFNRDYTSGYLFNDSNLLKGDYSGNKGIIIGKVIGYNRKKKRVLIKLIQSLYQGDSIVFESIDKGRPVNKIFLKGKLISKAVKDDVVEIEFDYFVNKGPVRKTVDKLLCEKLQKTYRDENVKIDINMQLTALIKHPLKLKILCQNDEIEVVSQHICEKAINQPTDLNRIKEQLSKLGNTCFQVKNIDIHKDEVMIPVSILNQLRREAIERLTKLRQNKKIHTTNFNSFDYKNSQKTLQKQSVFVLVSNINQLMTVLKHPVDMIFYPYQKDALKAFNLCYQRNQKMGLFIPRIVKSKELDIIKKSQIYNKVDNIIVNDMGAYYYFSDKNIILGTGTNIYNSYSILSFNKKCILSLEVSKKQMQKFDSQKAILQVYGKVENMISEFCPVTQHYHHNQKKKCGQCYGNQYSLIDRKNEEFDLLLDEQCRMHLLNNRVLYIDDLHNLNIKSYFLHFTNEDLEEVENVLNDYILSIFKGNSSKYRYMAKYTMSYF